MLILAACGSDSTTTASDTTSGMTGWTGPAYTVIENTVTVNANGCLELSFAGISFDGGISTSSSTFSLSGTWDAANSFLQMSAFGTISGTGITGAYTVQFYLDDSVLGPTALGVNRMLLFDTTSNQPASGTSNIAPANGFPAVAAGEGFTWSSEFSPNSQTAGSWWPNTSDFTVNPSGDVNSTVMGVPSGTAVGLRALNTTICTASF